MTSSAALLRLPRNSASRTAGYVGTPELQRRPARERERILRTVKLAQEFGAKTAILAGSDPAAEVVEYARLHNCSKLVVGRPRRISKWPWVRGTAHRIGALAQDIDLTEVGRSVAQAAPSRDAGAALERDPRRGVKRQRYVWAAVACLATSLVAMLLLPYFDLANIVMLFLLTVVLVALKWGRGPAILAAFVSVATFDFFFVAPRFSFAVGDFQYLLTFAVMLAVALIIGQMTADCAANSRRIVSGRTRPDPLRIRATCRACCSRTMSSAPRRDHRAHVSAGRDRGRQATASCAHQPAGSCSRSGRRAVGDKGASCRPNGHGPAMNALPAAARRCARAVCS